MSTRRASSRKKLQSDTTRPRRSAPWRRRLGAVFGSLRVQLLVVLWVPAIIAVGALSYVAIQTSNEAARDRELSTIVQLGEGLQAYSAALDTEARSAIGLHGKDFETATAETDVVLDDLLTQVEKSQASIPDALLPTVTELQTVGTTQRDQLRELVRSGQFDPAGALGSYLELRAAIGSMPAVFGNDVSSTSLRADLGAVSETMILWARLSNEQMLVALAQDGRATPADVAGAIRDTNVADRETAIALQALEGTRPSVGQWSEEVGLSRQVFSVSGGAGLAGAGMTVSPDLLSEALNRSIAARDASEEVLQKALGAAMASNDAATMRLGVTMTLAVFVFILAAASAPILSRRVIGPLLHLISATQERAEALPRQLEAIEQGKNPPPIEPIDLPRAGLEVRRFASRLNGLVGTAVELATREAQQRAAVVGMLRTVAHREAALVNRQLELLDKYERHEVDPVFLSRLFNLDHVTTQMRRLCDSLLVLAGASPVRRTTPPLSLVDVVRGASSQIQQYSRIDLDVWYDPRVHGHKVSDLTLLLAELLDNATKYSHPDTRVAVTFTRGVDGGIITIADQGIGFDDAALATAQAQVDHADENSFAMFDRLGLQTVAKLCVRTGVSVTFSGGSEVSGTRAAVRIPDAVLADPTSGGSLRLSTAAVGESFDDSVNRPASMTLYGQRQA